MGIQEKKQKQNDPSEMIEEFFEKMSVILEKKKPMKEISLEAEKLKKELKEKYNIK